mmetsp:Transcript_75835/g.126428  ORF Transcript_75835/g.126428 Transcript_75835/m.126428 type:complete len:192 (+) Transcript_75835:15-590(+)
MALIPFIGLVAPVQRVAPSLERGRALSRLTPVRCADDGDLFGGLISNEDNPYITSSADRIRAKYGKEYVEGRSARSGGREEAELRLAADIAEFKREKGISDAKIEIEEPTALQSVINTLGTILTFNFFIICIFFAWFLTGVGAQYGAQNDAIITAFRGAWDLIIQPLLGTHMLLTFLSAGLERVAKTEQAQ